MHPAAFRWVQRALADLPPRRSVVEIGSRDLNGSVRPLFGDAAYLGIDLYPGYGVDLVADAVVFAPDAPVDTVVCCEVLEHACNPAALCRAAYTWLHPSGVFLVTAAGEGRPVHSGIDGEPRLLDGEVYANISAGQLADWLAPFGEAVAIVVDREAHDIYGFAVKSA